MSIASAHVDLVARDRGFSTAMRGVQRSMQTLKAHMDTVALQAKVLFVASSAGVGALLRVASDMEEESSKFAAVFRDLTGEARDFVDASSEAWNRSRLQLIRFMATLQNTFVPFGFARRESMELSKQLTQLAVDLASFNNASDQETLQLLTSALVGNHEAVRRFGISITEATLKQELLNMGLRGGVMAANEQQKVMARYAIIMRATKDAQGDAARTSGSLANQWKGLQASVESLSVALGQAFIPSAKTAIDWIRASIDPLKEWVVANQAATLAIGALGLGVVSMLAFGSNIIATFGAIGKVVTWAFGAIGALGGGLQALITGILAATSSAGAFGSMLGGLVATLVGFGGAIAGVLAVAWPLILIFAAFAAGAYLLNSAFGDAAEKAADVEAAIAKTTKSVGALRQAKADAASAQTAEEAADAYDRQAKSLKDLAEAERSRGGRDSAAQAAAFERQAAAAADQAESLRKAAKSQELTDSIVADEEKRRERIAASAKEELNTLFLKRDQLGKTATEQRDLERWAKGYTEEQRAVLRAVDEQIVAGEKLIEQDKKRLEAAAELAKRYQDQVQAMVSSILDLAGESGVADTDEIARMNLENAGFNKQQVEKLMRLREEKDAWQKLIDVKKAGEAITRRNMTTEEEVAEARAAAREALDAGTISAETYGREMERLNRVLAEELLGNMGRLTGLTAEYDRIQSAAMKSLRVRQAEADRADAMAANGQQRSTIMEQAASAVKDIREYMGRLLDKLPVAGVAG